MADIFRTLIVPDANVVLARAIAASFGSGGVGMWTTGLSADGAEPATHYVSSGGVPDFYAFYVPCQTWEWVRPEGEQGSWQMTGSTPGDPVALYNWCAEEQYAPNPDDPENPIPLGPRVPCTQQDIDDLFAAADVTEQEPFTAFARLGLQIVQTPLA